MTDGTPGWYLDKDDPALARWHDGTDWTEHTLVIADQEPGSEPPPPAPARGKSDAQLQRERVAAANEKRAARSGGFPRWAPIAVAVVVGVLAAGAFAVLGGDDDEPTTVDTQGVSIDEALEVARDSDFPSQVGDARLSGLIEDLCEAADRPARTATLSSELERLPLRPGQLSDAIDALGDGAEAYCPDSASGVRTAVNQLQRQAGSDDELATDTTFPSVEGGVVDGSSSTIAGDGESTGTTARSTATTSRRTTATTRPAPTTTTVPPTTTTTIPKLSPGQLGKPCSPAGAAAQFAGQPYTCRSVCDGQPPEWAKNSSSCMSATTTSVPGGFPSIPDGTTTN